jgi:DNA-directed RNA polymerase specialized sigma subunit
MAKFELMEKTEINGEVWYYIRKEDGFSVNNSWTKNIEDAEKLLQEIQKGKLEPITKILKTIEVND